MLKRHTLDKVTLGITPATPLIELCQGWSCLFVFKPCMTQENYQHCQLYQARYPLREMAKLIEQLTFTKRVILPPCFVAIPSCTGLPPPLNIHVPGTVFKLTDRICLAGYVFQTGLWSDSSPWHVKQHKSQHRKAVNTCAWKQERERGGDQNHHLLFHKQKAGCHP